MKPTPFRLLVTLVLFCSACAAAEPTPQKESESPPKPYRQSRPAPVTKAEPQRIPSDAVTVKEGTTEAQPTALPVAPAVDEKAGEPMDPAAAAEAAREAEKTRAAEKAAALALGEGERYVLRLKAYEAARSGASRTPLAPVRKNSIAQLELADGRCIVIVGGNRTVFATKAAADAHVAEIRQAELERPIILGTSPKK